MSSTKATVKKSKSTPTKGKANPLAKTYTLEPKMSEKSYALSQLENTFVFEVDTSMNKLQIKQAVEAQFSVSVKNVRTLVAKGKKKPSFRKRTRSVYGKKPNIKNAYVKLTEGNSIPVFAAIEKAEEKEKKMAEKAAKKMKKGESK